jgi:two-component system chemotaxis response regulator CheY
MGRVAKTYNFQRISLLIAEPSRYMRTLLVGLSRSFGFATVFEAADGEAALNIMRERHVDIVLVDGPMEPMSGYAFVHHIRNAPDSPNPFLPVIMVSAHTAKSEVMRARDAGITEFLAKPISSKTLLSRLCSVVDTLRAFVRCATYVGPDRRRRTDPSFIGPERRGVPKPSAVAAGAAEPDPVLVDTSVT